MSAIIYFTPIYNAEFLFEECEIEKNSKIRKISEFEKEWFEDFYKNYTPVITNIYDLTHILEIKIDVDVESPSLEVETRINELISLLRVFKNGDLRIGGLYYYPDSNKIKRINYEPMDAYSSKKFTIQEEEIEEIKKFLEKASKCFPNIEKKDFFDRSITRFSYAIEKDDSIEKILDLVISLEVLLIFGVGDSTLKISQRSSILTSKNDDEIIENFHFVSICYGFRSGIVHEGKERSLHEYAEMEKKGVAERLEGLVRDIIKKMIIFSQFPENEILYEEKGSYHEKLTEQIDNLLLNRNLWEEYKKNI